MTKLLLHYASHFENRIAIAIFGLIIENVINDRRANGSLSSFPPDATGGMRIAQLASRVCNTLK